ncbi:MAG: DUF4194 domain-containing protein [Pirellulaceae bacterium]|nr:DUF4194 domain-containing protein [Pirellulaceae bacterium]
MISSSESDTTQEASDRQLNTVEWSPAAVRLLQGVVYHDDNAKTWDTLLRSISPLTEYFSKIGLLLIVDESEGMAYLRQLDEDELSSERDVVPRLFRRTPMGYETSLLCVLLRDLLRQFEEEDVQNERCVINHDELLAIWKAIFNKQSDEVKLNRSLLSSLRKLEELKFVKQFEDEPPSWEIRRIIKARLPLADLEQLRASLMAAAEAVDSEKDS